MSVITNAEGKAVYYLSIRDLYNWITVYKIIVQLEEENSITWHITTKMILAKMREKGIGRSAQAAARLLYEMASKGFIMNRKMFVHGKYLTSWRTAKSNPHRTYEMLVRSYKVSYAKREAKIKEFEGEENDFVQEEP